LYLSAARTQLGDCIERIKVAVALNHGGRNMTTTAATRPVEACLVELFQHLGIERAHIVAGRMVRSDWHGLATVYPEHVASLTLISPQILGPGELGGLASRLLAVAGDHGPTAEGTVKLLADLPDATTHILRGYEYLPGQTSLPSVVRRLVRRYSASSPASTTAARSPD
jgi:pimeloyl-ACP methyl ester carboxylesterase